MTSEAPPSARPEGSAATPERIAVRATSVPYRAGTEGYASFRIPAVTVTPEGTLLAFAEGRRASDEDFGDIDIVLRRSTDGGASWDPMTVVSANGDDLAGNPAPIATAAGRVVLVQVHNAAAATEDAIRRGRLYFTARNDSTSPGSRADAYSTDGGATLELPFRPQAGLVAPVVEGSVLQLDDRGPLLFSGPAHPAERALMTLRASTDAGITWRDVRTVDGLPAAYSDLVRIDADTVGLLYETGDFSAYSTLSFLRIPLSDLTF